MENTFKNKINLILLISSCYLIPSCAETEVASPFTEVPNTFTTSPLNFTETKEYLQKHKAFLDEILSNDLMTKLTQNQNLATHIKNSWAAKNYNFNTYSYFPKLISLINTSILEENTNPSAPNTNLFELEIPSDTSSITDAVIKNLIEDTNNLNINSPYKFYLIANKHELIENNITKEISLFELYYTEENSIEKKSIAKFSLTTIVDNLSEEVKVREFEIILDDIVENISSIKNIYKKYVKEDLPIDINNFTTSGGGSLVFGHKSNTSSYYLGFRSNGSSIISEDSSEIRRG